MTRTAVKFGAFVVLCLSFTAILAATIGNTTIGGLVGRGPRTYQIAAAFDDVTGLLVDDNVKIAGVAVGKVTGIDVEAGRAIVTMRIHSDRVVPEDTRATIRWRNLIGQRYVYLDPGTAATRLEPGALIEDTSNVIDLGELFNRLGPIVAAIDPAKVNAFLDTITSALDGNQAELSVALDDLAHVVSELGQRDESIGRLIENLEIVSRTVADRDGQIETMLTNLSALSQTFSDNTALLEEALVEMGAFNRDLSTVLSGNQAELDRIVTNVDQTLLTVVAELGSVNLALDRLDDTARAIFLTSADGEFLNQSILCLTVTAPPCPTPIVSGLGSVIGASSGSATDFQMPIRTGGAALLSLLGGGR